jgi:hypothetical protein
MSEYSDPESGARSYHGLTLHISGKKLESWRWLEYSHVVSEKFLCSVRRLLFTATFLVHRFLSP